MTYTVSITKQGQISIPVELRRRLGLERSGKALVSERGGKIVIEPVQNIMELAGSLGHKSLKGKNIDEILEIEKKAVEDGWGERYLKDKKKRK